MSKACASTTLLLTRLCEKSGTANRRPSVYTRNCCLINLCHVNTIFDVISLRIWTSVRWRLNLRTAKSAARRNAPRVSSKGTIKAKFSESCPALRWESSFGFVFGWGWRVSFSAYPSPPQRNPRCKIRATPLQHYSDILNIGRQVF